MNSIITHPGVYIIGASMVSPEAITDWAVEEGLEEVVQDTTTPLGRIVSELSQEETSSSDLDLLSEFAGRGCYQSWKTGRDSPQYMDNILTSLHGSTLEHASMTLLITGVSRSLTHELIRHRAGFAVSQESQRFVTADSANFVVPPLLLHGVDGNIDAAEIGDWMMANMNALQTYSQQYEWYRQLLEDEGVDGRMAKKRAAEAARSHLPNATETRLVWTGNLRALRHFAETRGAHDADLEIRRLACEVVLAAKHMAPLAFSDFVVQEGAFGVGVVQHIHRKV